MSNNDPGTLPWFRERINAFASSYPNWNLDEYPGRHNLAYSLDDGLEGDNTEFLMPHLEAFAGPEAGHTSLDDPTVRESLANHLHGNWAMVQAEAKATANAAVKAMKAIVAWPPNGDWQEIPQPSEITETAKVAFYYSTEDLSLGNVIVTISFGDESEQAKGKEANDGEENSLR